MSRPRRVLWIAAGTAFVWLAVVWVGYSRGSHLSALDFYTSLGGMRPVGQISGEPLARLHLTAADLAPAGEAGAVRYLGISRYLNGARAVVTHTIDDSTRYLPACINTLDKYGVKATIFVSTQVEPISSLWPRLEQAVRDGHEIGSHSRRHQCHWPDAFPFCFRAYTAYEIEGSRNDILQHTSQTYVWSWCYPCGNCSAFDFVHRKLARAGYIVARNYPNEEHDGHLLPDLQTYDVDPYNATYTQVVQKQGGIAASGRTDVATLNAKFDQVYLREGIYNFMSHPQWLDYGPDR